MLMNQLESCVFFHFNRKKQNEDIFNDSSCFDLYHKLNSCMYRIELKYVLFMKNDNLINQNIRIFIIEITDETKSNESLAKNSFILIVFISCR